MLVDIAGGYCTLAVLINLWQLCAERATTRGKLGPPNIIVSFYVLELRSQVLVCHSRLLKNDAHLFSCCIVLAPVAAELQRMEL